MTSVTNDKTDVLGSRKSNRLLNICRSRGIDCISNIVAELTRALFWLKRVTALVCKERRHYRRRRLVAGYCQNCATVKMSITHWIFSNCHCAFKLSHCALLKDAPWHGAPSGTVATSRPPTVLFNFVHSRLEGHVLSPGKVLHWLGGWLVARAAPKKVSPRSVSCIVFPC